MDGILTWASIKPDAPAYGMGEDVVTFGALADEARHWATGLEALGVEKGSRCAIALPSCVDFFRALYALQVLGAWPVCINPDLPPETILGRIQQLNCSVLILADSDNRDWRGAAREVPCAGQRVVSTEEVRWKAARPLTGAARCEPDDLAFLGLTSGTTGAPKAGMVPHRALVRSYHANWQWMESRDDDILATWSPHFLTMGIVHFVYYVAYSGCPCYFTPPSATSAIQWLHLISRVRATVTGGTNFGYRVATQLVRPESVDLSCLRFAFAGGDAGAFEIIDAFEKRFGLAGVVRPNYGMTEAVNSLAVARPGKGLRVSKEGALTCGEASNGVELGIFDDQGRRLPPGARGEIRGRSEYLFRGYYADPELTRETLCDGWLRTGDIGMLDKDGWLYVLGRSKAMIKRGGATIMPHEVEQAASRVEGVLLAAAIGLPRSGERGMEDIVVVCEAAPERTAHPELREALGKDISRAIEHALGFGPNDVRFAAPGMLPRDPNGKAPYSDLKQRLAAGEFQ